MELYSVCCGYNHDERFYYDEESKLGICVYCQDHSEFEETEDDN